MSYSAMMSRSAKGLTLPEMLFVVSIIAIVTAIAVPSFVQMRNSMKDRQVARDIVSMLRRAKSEAISKNREHQVFFDAANRRYGWQKGGRAYGNGLMSSATITQWTPYNTTVSVATTTTAAIQFTPNGASSIPGAINIQDYEAGNKFTVIVETTGAIRVDGPH